MAISGPPPSTPPAAGASPNPAVVRPAPTSAPLIPPTGIVPVTLTNGTLASLRFSGYSQRDFMQEFGPATSGQPRTSDVVVRPLPEVSEQEFAAREQEVMTDFLARHPYRLPLLYRNIKGTEETTDGDFDQSFLGVTHGSGATASKAPARPSFWKRHSGLLLQQVPFGVSLSKLAGGTTHLGDNSDAQAIDEVARQNVLNFRSLVAQYLGQSASAAFDAGTAAEQVSIFLDAFGALAADMDFPCPWSVFNLNLDEYHTETTAEATTRQLILLNGGDVSDYANVKSMTRQQKTALMRRALLQQIARARAAATSRSPEDLINLAQPVRVQINRNDQQWTYFDQGTSYTDRQLILTFFGKDELSRFDALPTGSVAKRDTRVATFILAIEFRAAGSVLIE